MLKIKRRRLTTEAFTSISVQFYVLLNQITRMGGSDKTPYTTQKLIEPFKWAARCVQSASLEVHFHINGK